VEVITAKAVLAFCGVSILVAISALIVVGIVWAIYRIIKNWENPIDIDDMFP